MKKEGFYERYQQLQARASEGRPVPVCYAEYLAALYILAADEEIFELALDCVSCAGIDFIWLYEKMDSAGLMAHQYTLVQVAESLFRDHDAEPFPLFDLIALDYDDLDIVVNALYIRKSRGRVPACDSNGSMTLDCSYENCIRRMLDLTSSTD